MNDPCEHLRSDGQLGECKYVHVCMYVNNHVAPSISPLILFFFFACVIYLFFLFLNCYTIL